MKPLLTLPAKSLALLLAVCALASSARAQEVIALDQAQKIAQKLATVYTASNDQPFTVTIDVDKPAGLKGGDAGLIVLPDRKLSAETFANAGKTVTPVGQLWTYHVNLANNGISIENSKVRTLTFDDGDKAHDVQLFLLGVAKSEQGALELVVYGKGSEPILRAPLTKTSSDKQELPIELSGRKTGENSAALTLNLSGQYTADLAVVKAGE
jgi:hypothetical protein